MKNPMYSLVLISLVLMSCTKDSPDPGDVLPQLSAQGISISEGNIDSKIVVDFRLNKTSNDVVHGVIQTEDGTAKSGEDYVPVNHQIISFEPGEIRTSYTISILGDVDPEEDEFFNIIITNTEGAVFDGAPVVVILENDDAKADYSVPTSGYETPESYDGMISVWSDEFNDEQLDTKYWTHEIGNGSGGWGNNELQYYRKENTYFKDGSLVIEARKENFSGFKYTSSRLITRNKFDFRFGRIDVRAALPQGQGLWPAIWLLGSSFATVGWPACGEIDIMEMVGGQGRENTTHGTAHWSEGGSHASFSEAYTLSKGSFQNDFHVFSVIWDETTIEWYVDDLKFHEMDITSSGKSEFLFDHFLILNVAVGGNWPGNPNATTDFPQRMGLDYVRVFQGQD